MDGMKEKIDALLQNAGLKRTRQREWILSLLAEGDVHLTAEQIYTA